MHRAFLGRKKSPTDRTNRRRYEVYQRHHMTAFHVASMSRGAAGSKW